MHQPALVSRLTQRPVALGTVLAALAAVAYGSTQFLARHIVTHYAPPLVVATLALATGTIVLGLAGNRTFAKDRRASKRAFAFLALAHIVLQRMEHITLRIWLGASLVVGGVILITLGSV